MVVVASIIVTVKKKSPYQDPEEREDRRGRRPISELALADIKCEKCNLIFQTKKEKKKHVSANHRI
jgi:hypothetical protein